jgi:hypothetical protein
LRRTKDTDMNRYGMKHSTITYWQKQARTLMLHNSITAGLGTLRNVNDGMAAREIGHAAIQAAATMRADKLRAVLADRTAAVAAKLGIDLQAHPVSSMTVNRLLRALGHAEKLVAGRGYLYFVDGGTSGWYSSSVPVCYLRDLTVGRWVEEHAALKADPRNH